jgi:hypothetical protein
MKYRESRCLIADQCELRAADDGDAPVIEGRTAPFDVFSEDLGFGREIIRPGAFKRSLGRKDNEVVALWQHLEEYPLARRAAGNLDVSEDEFGLAFEIRPDDTSYARDLRASIRGGTVRHTSFGFRVIEDRWGTENGGTIRELIEVQLFDVSPVTTPAYPQTDVAVRSLLMHEGAKDEEIEGLSGTLESLRDPQLTAVEFRSILDPITRVFRERRDGSGPESHSDQQSREGTKNRRSRIDGLERLGALGQ